MIIMAEIINEHLLLIGELMSKLKEEKEDEYLKDADLWDDRKLGAEEEYVRKATPEEVKVINKALNK